MDNFIDYLVINNVLAYQYKPGAQVVRSGNKTQAASGENSARFQKKQKTGLQNGETKRWAKGRPFEKAGASLQECGRPRPQQRVSVAAMVIVSQSVMAWPFVVMD